MIADEEIKRRMINAINNAIETAKAINTASMEDSYKLGEIQGLLQVIKIYIS